ncbi:MAG TPA: hypothetical protein V6D08_11385, partial [Candidatus Obscuribacterales bacterium]
IGYFFASITLTDYYDNPAGHVTDWLLNTSKAFLIFGFVPAALCFAQGYSQNRTTTKADASGESRAPV